MNQRLPFLTRTRAPTNESVSKRVARRLPARGLGSCAVRRLWVPKGGTVIPRQKLGSCRAGVSSKQVSVHLVELDHGRSVPSQPVHSPRLPSASFILRLSQHLPQLLGGRTITGGRSLATSGGSCEITADGILTKYLPPSAQPLMRGSAFRGVQGPGGSPQDGTGRDGCSFTT